MAMIRQVERAEAGGVALYPPRTPAGLDPRNRSEFIERLVLFRTRAEAAARSQVGPVLQILDLENLRSRFASRWRQVADKALGIVEHAIRQGLAPGDLYLAINETRFLILRMHMRRTEADWQLAKVAAALTERLLGTIPGGMAGEVRTLPFDPISMLTGVATLSELVGRVDALFQASESIEYELFQTYAPKVFCTWRPTVDLRRSSLFAYHLALTVKEGQAPGRSLATICPDSPNGVFDAESDILALQQVTRSLVRMPLEETALLMVPVHYTTLARRHLRERWLPKLRRLPQSASQRLAFELVGLPPATVQSRVRTIMAYLSSASHSTFVRLPYDVAYAGHLDSTGVSGLSLDRRDLSPEDDAPELFALHAQAARELGVDAILHGARDVEDCREAVRAGFVFLNGDGFSLPTQPAARLTAPPA